VTAEIEHELRSTSDTLLATLEQLEQLETEKRTLPPDSERFQKLAREIERLAAVVFAESHDQQQLGKRSQELSQRQGVALGAIDDMTPTRDVSVILGEWRAAERAFSTAEQDTSERAQAAADIKRLREEYQRAYSAQSGPKSTKG